MSKNTELKLVGQPIFSQILKLIDKWEFNKLVKFHNSDRYYKSFKSWDHLVTMLFGILSRCDSMAETCECFELYGGVQNHIDYYHNKIHHTTEQTPNERYEKSIKKAA